MIALGPEVAIDVPASVGALAALLVGFGSVLAGIASCWSLLHSRKIARTTRDTNVVARDTNVVVRGIDKAVNGVPPEEATIGQKVEAAAAVLPLVEELRATVERLERKLDDKEGKA